MDIQFDQDALNNIKAMMKDKYLKMSERYLVNAKNYLAQVAEGIETADLQKIVDNAHPLKSSSAMLGMTSLSKLAEEMELTAKTHINEETTCDLSAMGQLHDHALACYQFAQEIL